MDGRWRGRPCSRWPPSCLFSGLRRYAGLVPSCRVSHPSDDRRSVPPRAAPCHGARDLGGARSCVPWLIFSAGDFTPQFSVWIRQKANAGPSPGNVMHGSDWLLFVLLWVVFPALWAPAATTIAAPDFPAGMSRDRSGYCDGRCTGFCFASSSLSASGFHAS